MCAVRALTWKAADLNRLRPARERANVNGSFSAAEMRSLRESYRLADPPGGAAAFAGNSRYSSARFQ